MFDLMRNGKVISIDIEARPNMPVHNRIEFITASSSNKNVFNSVRQKIAPEKVVIVVLYSDHSMKYMYEEMELWSDLVSIDSYMIVKILT